LTDIAFPAAMAACLLLLPVLDLVRAPRLLVLAVAILSIVGILFISNFDYQILVPDPYGSVVADALMIGVIAGSLMRLISAMRRLSPDRREAPDKGG
jgi:phosphatidylserine synthase